MMLRQQARIRRLTDAPEQRRRALDIGEEKGQSSRGTKPKLKRRPATHSCAAADESDCSLERRCGRPISPSRVSQRFDTLAARAGLPPITLYGLSHGSATMAVAASVPIKAIGEMLGHGTSAFTADVYTEVAEELTDAARRQPSLLTCPAAARSLPVPFSVPSGGPDDQ
jgi:integrase